MRGHKTEHEKEPSKKFSRFFQRNFQVKFFPSNRLKIFRMIAGESNIKKFKCLNQAILINLLAQSVAFYLTITSNPSE